MVQALVVFILWWWFSHQVMSSSCDPMDCSPPASSVHGILQAKILKWFAIPSPGDLPDQGIEPGSPALEADSSPTELLGKPFLSCMKVHIYDGFYWGVDFSNIYSMYSWILNKT